MSDELRILAELFKENDRYQAHFKAAPILKELARNREFLFSVMKKNLQDEKFLLRPMHHPVIAVPVFENHDFSLIAHLWFPLPTRETDVTHQTIHHHGKLLLSSVAPIGPGYESILFKKGFEIDYQTLEAKMEIDRVYQNVQYNLEFIDVNTPHVVFFPKEFSITFAMWSTFEKAKVDKFKRSPLVQKFKKPLSTVIKKVGLSKFVGLNLPQYYDFYPCNGKLVVMKERNFGYKPGDNNHFVQNICSALYHIGFNDASFLNQLSIKFKEIDHSVGINSIERLMRNEKVNDAFVSHQIGIPQVNIKKSEILEVFSKI